MVKFSIQNSEFSIIFSRLMSLVFSLLIRGYQKFFAPFLPGGCRFEPTCSEYMLQAIEKHGCLKGLGLGIWRILRCNPWNPGGYDPVP